MVQFLDLPPQSTGQRLMQGLGLASQSIPEMIGSFQNKKLSQDILSLDPKNKMNQIVSKIIESGVPENQQQMLFKMLSSSDPFKQQQQERLALDSILNRYSKRIAEIDSAIKSGIGSYEERKKMEQQRSALQAERDKLLGFSSIMDEEIPMDQEMNSQQVDSEKKSMKEWDVNNPEHIARRDELLKKTKGNRKQAEQLLLKEFYL